jgi:hypothetical protein
MKFAADRPFCQSGSCRAQDCRDRQHRRAGPGRPHNIEKINGPFLYEFKSSPEEYGAGIQLAIERAGSGCTRAAPT